MSDIRVMVSCVNENIKLINKTIYLDRHFEIALTTLEGPLTGSNYGIAWMVTTESATVAYSEPGWGGRG